MPTLTPTFDTGATTMPLLTLSVPAARQHLLGPGARTLDDAGYNGAFIEGMLSQALTHERCGRHLYRSVAQRTNNTALKRRYEDFGAETEEHVAILEDLIISMGGDPQYVSPAARATEKADMAALQATFLLGGSVDLMTQESVMLDAVVVAEILDRANWIALDRLSARLAKEDVGRAMRSAVDRVLPEEEEHLGWATKTKLQLTLQQATHPTITELKTSMAEMTAAIKAWFTDEGGPVPGADTADGAI